jgi:hypothetical protein
MKHKRLTIVLVKRFVSGSRLAERHRSVGKERDECGRHAELDSWHLRTKAPPEDTILVYWN